VPSLIVAHVTTPAHGIRTTPGQPRRSGCRGHGGKDLPRKPTVGGSHGRV